MEDPKAGLFATSQLLESFARTAGALHESIPYTNDQLGVVQLRFNAFDVQSEMRKNAPYDLVLRYTRTMAEVMARRPGAQHIGMIGLGGGSLPKYAYRKFPASKISVAEINPEVIGLRKKFHVPDNDHRFSVLCEDGAEFVSRFKDEFDLLLVDGYDRSGQPPQLCSLRFYRDCHRALAPDGLLIVNICANHQLIDRMQRCLFDQVDLEDDDEKCANTIVVAHKTTIGPIRVKRTVG